MKSFQIIKNKFAVLNYLISANKIGFISDGANWVLDEIALSIQKYINKQIPFDVIALHQAEQLTFKLYHYSTIYNLDYLLLNYLPHAKHIITIFHVAAEHEQMVKKLADNQHKIDFIHTSCEITKSNLVRLGINSKKIRVIPIGIDVNNFFPDSTIRKNVRKTIGASDNHIVIGSFQKDGNGWGEGLEPKLIKGPDIFCDVMIELNKKYPIFVFLTGPARGYVKKRLHENNIKFHHILEDDYQIISKYYNALDAYFVSSRVEGGPRAPMEAMASGIPVISTKVGQVPELIAHGKNGLIVSFDKEKIVGEFEKLFLDDTLRKTIIKNGLITVKEYDYKKISEIYFNKLYKPLL